jgi:hypothetical protein
MLLLESKAMKFKRICDEQYFDILIKLYKKDNENKSYKVINGEIEHRKIYENYYGISIPDGYIIHHMDGNKRNNDIHNLKLMEKKCHNRLHGYIENCK